MPGWPTRNARNVIPCAGRQLAQNKERRIDGAAHAPEGLLLRRGDVRPPDGRGVAKRRQAREPVGPLEQPRARRVPQPRRLLRRQRLHPSPQRGLPDLQGPRPHELPHLDPVEPPARHGRQRQPGGREVLPRPLRRRRGRGPRVLREPVPLRHAGLSLPPRRLGEPRGRRGVRQLRRQGVRVLREGDPLLVYLQRAHRGARPAL